jgi:hypothetical protein
MKMKPREKNVKTKGEENFLVDKSTVLRIALEDAETSHFILTYFSHPEQRPRIISRKKIILQDRKYRWIIELIEKIPFCFNGKKEMMNIARIEVDPFCGAIVGRQYFKNLFEEEYRRIVKQTNVV